MDLQERGRSLEEQFFLGQNQELIERLKQAQDAQARQQKLGEVLGIDDAELLARLDGLGLNSNVATAIQFYPLVYVAWSDGDIDEREESAVARALKDQGVNSDTQAIVGKWLQKKPREELALAWKSYVEELHKHLPLADFQRLKESSLNQAKNVASAAGGFLGLGQKISAAEQKALKELEETLAL
jgi:hypothetical protein